MSVYSIKETKEILAFGLSLYSVAKAALKDGKLGIEDVALLPALIAPAKAAFEGSQESVKELFDLQAGELDELLAMARPVIEDVTPDALEPTVWKIIGIAVAIGELVGVIEE